MITGIQAGLAGVQAFQRKVDAAAENVANATTDGYKARRVLLQEGEQGAVRTVEDRVQAEGPRILEARGTGTELVEKSNVDLTRELPEMRLGQRGFEANLASIRTADEMLGSLLDIKK